MAAKKKTSDKQLGKRTPQEIMSAGRSYFAHAFRERYPGYGPTQVTVEQLYETCRNQRTTPQKFLAACEADASKEMKRQLKEAGIDLP